MNNDQIFEIAKEVVVSNSNDIYSDVRPLVQETLGVFSTVVGLFNNVVLYYIKKANITYRYKLELFEEDLKNEVMKIPPEKQIEPPLSIAGPILESLKYKYDEKELREMFVKLLASAMNSDTSNLTHPAFIEIIKQLSPFEAKILACFKGGTLSPTADYVLKNSSFSVISNVASIAFKLNDCIDIDKISTSITNLIRLGLLERTHSVDIENVDEASKETHIKIFKEQFETEELMLQVRAKLVGGDNKVNNNMFDIISIILKTTIFGESFIKTCI